MRILIAEDDMTSRLVLERVLSGWGYEVIATGDGAEAWEKFQAPDPPKVVILDRMMPKMDGLTLCRKIRARDSDNPTYIIHLTTLDSKQDIVDGFEAGSDDYITKPFDNAELKARVNVGARLVELRSELAGRVVELEEALQHIKQLQGILPICAYCHKIRDDEDVWQRLESYVEDHTQARFSHSYCPDCLEKYYPED
jgi:sigma-B regulation protein RsbU (phosphoserine phosphatase)